MKENTGIDASNYEEEELEGPPPPNLFLLIFRRPAEAVKYALENAPESWIHRNFILIAFFFVLLTRVPQWVSGGANPIEVLIMVFVMPSLVGVLLSYIFSACIRNLARWIYKIDLHKIEMRTVVAWSHFPFTVAYGAALATYLLMFFLRTPEQQEKVFTGRTSDLIPLIVLGLLFLVALWIRWKSFSFVFQISMGKSALLWILGFFMTYGPALLFATVYVAIYVRSMSWLAFKFGV